MELVLIQKKIFEIRGYKVMLDFDLAELYDVGTKVLNQAVKRNMERFPTRFMFRLTVAEWKSIRSQIVTASGQAKRNIGITPFAFTEHGITMLSAVLRSDTAIKVSIAIVDAFILLKEFASNYKELAAQLKELESKYDRKFADVYEAINYLLQKDKQETKQKERKRIGFKS
jgi:hypothetical protein